ncbi:hypothetical protein [Actinoalloteichus sp. GBA129-24]|uniref:hypothetical protein n=1 Tax=Actinoalloteichus sp. GBA129-24 TaxID=1612551 RepID=UPI0009506252|nr:hypothetical protein [Actinoalloteichus sp. GBA129-24]APU20914.1 hypothetical protein UA75_14520 [Actinoalloteichus sp. GBA129-24]APU24163.1 hypothetical protein UA75_31000 [Actinoalloteichus sp. GBA129-24]
MSDTTYTEAQLREYATYVITEHARDVEYLSIGEMADGHLGGDLSDEQHRRVSELIRGASVAVILPTD